MKYLKTMLIIIAAAGLARGVTIYQDTFSTDGVLSGRAVETGTGNWIAYSTLTTSNGVALPGATVNGKDAVLAFTPQAGVVYTLSADISAISGSSYIGVGFAANSVVPTGNELFANLVDTAAPWTYVVTNGTVATLLGPGGGGYSGFVGKGATGTIKIVLDTTGTNWVSTWYYNNAALRTNTYSGALTGINYVGFGTGGSLNATVDNFKLDVEYQRRLSLMVLSTL
jgi:hypothetical protein